MDQNQDLNKETADGVYFFTPPYYALDNYSAHQIKIWYKTFPTAEHAYQWKKFADSNVQIADRIFAAASPKEAKMIAEENKAKLMTSWHEQKAVVMEEILRAKTEQHQEVHDTLQKTAKKNIFENSSADSFWGVGPDGLGQNMCGKIWMKIRDGK